MRASKAVLGGGRRFYYPRFVWSPVGGWWHHMRATPEMSKRGWMIPILTLAVPIAICSYAAKEAEVWRMSALDYSEEDPMVVAARSPDA